MCPRISTHLVTCFQSHNCVTFMLQFSTHRYCSPSISPRLQSPFRVSFRSLYIYHLLTSISSLYYLPLCPPSLPPPSLSPYNTVFVSLTSPSSRSQIAAAGRPPGSGGRPARRGVLVPRHLHQLHSRRHRLPRRGPRRAVRGRAGAQGPAAGRRRARVHRHEQGPARARAPSARGVPPARRGDRGGRAPAREPGRVRPPQLRDKQLPALRHLLQDRPQGASRRLRGRRAPPEQPRRTVALQHHVGRTPPEVT